MSKSKKKRLTNGIKMKLLSMMLILILFTSCDWDGNTNGKRRSSLSNEGEGTIYSYSSGGSNYVGVALYDDNTMEFMQVMDLGGGSLAWIKITGTYSIVGTTVTATSLVYAEMDTDAGGPGACGVSVGTDFIFDYDELTDTLDMSVPAVATLSNETTSGLSLPDLSAEPNTCP